MRKHITHIWRFLCGEDTLPDRQKYSLMIYCVALVHVFLTFAFFYLKVTPMFLFNIGSVLSYLYAIFLIRQESYLPVYYITYFEILIHSLVATLCIGWQFGFGQYIIGIIPVGFYLSHTMKDIKHRLSVALISALIAMVAFMSCKILSCYVDPFYIIESRKIEIIFYIFNSMCTFAFLIILSVLFVYEVRITNARLRHQNAILDQMANTDPLTGLYNRRSMNLFLEQALESDSRFHVIMCDIDDFKKINDTHGHDFGDIVLQEIANITVNAVAESGYVCRWGGEEILILISNNTSEAVLRIAENIRKSVEYHIFELNQKLVHCTLTLGVAPHQKGDPFESTITKADANLYVGKQSGKNKVVM
jgi:diguanylate cyclase (GGDEF)-like protein